MKETRTPFYVESASYLSFRELCDICKEQSKIGMSFGRSGVGKTEASLRYTNWSLIDANFSVRTGIPIEPELLSRCDTIYYKPGITISPQKLKSELSTLRNRFEEVKVRALTWHRLGNWATAVQSKLVDLIVVDEAHRLKYSALEELRDLQERWSIGIVLIGDPGMERSLTRMYHFADRVRYVEKFEPLGLLDVSRYTDKWLEQMKLPKVAEEIYPLVAVYSRGNPRILGHLFALAQRLLSINDDIVSEFTREVLETAREMMLVGLGGSVATIDRSVETPSRVANAV